MTLKAEIRAGVGKPAVTSDATQTQTPDLEKLKEELRKEVKIEFQKKVNLLTAVSKSDLNAQNSGFNLYVARTKEH